MSPPTWCYKPKAPIPSEAPPSPKGEEIKDMLQIASPTLLYLTPIASLQTPQYRNMKGMQHIKLVQKIQSGNFSKVLR